MKRLRKFVTQAISCADPYYQVKCIDRQKLKEYRETQEFKPLSAESKRKINELWGRNSEWFEFYNTIGDRERVHLYFPHLWFHIYVDSKLNQWSLCAALDDKCLYDYLFYVVRRPKTVVRICRGQYVNEQGRLISLADAVAACKAVGSVIIKPSYGSSAVKGIVFWREGSDIDIEKVLRDSRDDIVQELITQHPSISQIHAESVNTVRIMTMTTEKGVEKLSAIIRLGVGKSKVDNFCQGGIAVGIDDNGKLKDKGYDAAGRCYDKHPDGADFRGVTVPGFQKCLAICQATAPRFMRYSRLTSWDFSTGADGEPILVEVNLCYGGLSFHRLCNGPIFGNEENTRRMIKQFYKR